MTALNSRSTGRQGAPPAFAPSHAGSGSSSSMALTSSSTAVSAPSPRRKERQTNFKVTT